MALEHRRDQRLDGATDLDSDPTDPALPLGIERALLRLRQDALDLGSVVPAGLVAFRLVPGFSTDGPRSERLLQPVLADPGANRVRGHLGEPGDVLLLAALVVVACPQPVAILVGYYAVRRHRSIEWPVKGELARRHAQPADDLVERRPALGGQEAMVARAGDRLAVFEFDAEDRLRPRRHHLLDAALHESLSLLVQAPQAKQLQPGSTVRGLRHLEEIAEGPFLCPVSPSLLQAFAVDERVAREAISPPRSMSHQLVRQAPADAGEDEVPDRVFQH